MILCVCLRWNVANQPRYPPLNVMPQSEGTDLLSCLCHQIGDCVRVINGQHGGESGMLAHTLQDERCVVILDLTKEEIQIFSRWVLGF